MVVLLAAATLLLAAIASPLVLFVALPTLALAAIARAEEPLVGPHRPGRRRSTRGGSRVRVLPGLLIRTART